MIDRLGLVLGVAVVGEISMLLVDGCDLGGGAVRTLLSDSGVHVVWAKVEGTQCAQRHLAVEAKAIEAYSGDLLAVLANSLHLSVEEVKIVSGRDTHDEGRDEGEGR